MIRLLILAALAITPTFVQAGVLAEERMPAAPAAKPQSDRADTARPSCPYHFGSDMPAGTFCVYQGVAFSDDGEVCATDVVVLWSSFDAQAAPERPEEASGSNREIYLAFAATPELVLRAIVDPRRNDRAAMVGYSGGSDEAPQAMAGRMTLRAKSLRSADVLSLDISEPRFHLGSCSFVSYSGTFLGMIRPPSETATSVDRLIVPGQ